MANIKITELPKATTIGENDLIPVVTGIGGTPVTEHITKYDFAATISSSPTENNPVENTYSDIAAMLADQGSQTTNYFNYVVDASADPNVVSGEAYYEKLTISTTTLSTDYRLLSDTEVTIVADSNSYRVFRIQDIQDEATPLTSVSGGKVSFEYNGANVTAILFNKLYTDAIEEFYGKDVSIRFHNRTTKRYETEAVASTAWTTVNTDYYRAEVTGTNIQIADLSANNRVEFFIVEAAAGGGSSTITESTGTTITFTQDTFWNNLTYLTSGNLTLDLTGAVVGTAAWVWCDRYIPTISGENFIISGVPSTSKLNIYKMVYNGVQTDDYDIDIVVDTKTYLVTPSITITPSDTVNTLSGFTVVNATSYEILSSTTNDIGTASAVSPAYDGTSSTYAHTGLTNGVTHYYWIKAINRSGYLDSDYGTASGASSNTAFEFYVTAADSTFVLPLVSTGTYNFDIYIDDVLGDTITVYNQAEATIDLGDTSNHKISLIGTIEGWQFSRNAQATKLTSVTNWGTLKFSGSATTSRQFDGCNNCTIYSATDVPNLTGTTSLYLAFYNNNSCSGITSLNSWDTSSITSINSWMENSTINTRHDDLDFTNVLTADSAYENNDVYNQPFTNLTMPSCTTFQHFVRNMALFNQPVDHLVTSAATDVHLMVNGTSAWSQDFANADWSGITGSNTLTTSSQFGTTNLTATYAGMIGQTFNSGVTLNFGTSTYTEGTGETGTADGTTASKLVDSGATFLSSGVAVNDILHNTTDDTFARITAIDSDTQLSLSDDIMVSGEAYTVQTSDAAKGRAVAVVDYNVTIVDNGAV